jgi:hypothetical protein
MQRFHNGDIVVADGFLKATSQSPFPSFLTIYSLLEFVVGVEDPNIKTPR